MSDDDDIHRLLPSMNANERRVWETIKAERAAGASAERLAGLERQAAGVRRGVRSIVQRDYEASSITEEQARQRGRGR